MTRIRNRLGAAFLAAALLAPAAPGFAQEITESHLAAALAAVQTARTSEGFNNVLPIISDQIKTNLITQRPDIHAEISAAVDAMAMELTVRRADLDRDVARIWARAFTEEELLAIADFYRSPAGIKLADVGPHVLQDSVKAVDAWSQRVGEELIEKSREELKRQGVEF